MTGTPAERTDVTPPGDGRGDSHSGGGVTGPIVVVALVSAISGLLYGYDTGIISGALLQITDEFGIGDGLQQVIAASILLGAVIGALTCSYLSERRGRKGTLVLIAIVFVVGAIWSALAPNPLLLSLGRLVLGFAVGGATQTAPMYVAELSPPKYRGRLVLCFQIAIGVGIVISTIVGATELVSWRVSIGSAAAPAAIMLGLMLRLPESPRWLVKREDHDGARDVLQRVRPEGYDIDGELQEIVGLRNNKRPPAAPIHRSMAERDNPHHHPDGTDVRHLRRDRLGGLVHEYLQVA